MMYQVSIKRLAKQASASYITATFAGMLIQHTQAGCELFCRVGTKEQAREITDFAHSLTNCYTEIQEVK